MLDFHRLEINATKKLPLSLQAYRGPSKPGEGYDTFAPWGFYVTQPKDDFKGYAYH